MKHETVIVAHPATTALGLSDEEVEARVFIELEAKQQKWAAKQNGVVIFAFPDDRTFFQRLCAWWYLHRQRVAAAKLIALTKLGPWRSSGF